MSSFQFFQFLPSLPVALRPGPGVCVCVCVYMCVLVCVLMYVYDGGARLFGHTQLADFTDQSDIAEGIRQWHPQLTMQAEQMFVYVLESKLFFTCCEKQNCYLIARVPAANFADAD